MDALWALGILLGTPALILFPDGQLPSRLDSVRDDLASVVQKTLEPAQVSLWLANATKQAVTAASS